LRVSSPRRFERRTRRRAGYRRLVRSRKLVCRTTGRECFVTLTAKLPSIGCLAVLFTNIALVAFLFWGFREPALHRVWELHHELEIGTVGKLSSEDHALL